MPTIYDVDFELQTTNLLPPRKRKPITTAFLNVAGDSLQYQRDLVLGDYADGSLAPDYTGAGNIIGQRVRYTDNAIYEAIDTVPAATPPTGLANDPYWIKVLDIFIGIRERANFNPQTIMMEWALNRIFRTNFAYRPTLPDIYIENNTMNNLGNPFEYNTAELKNKFIKNTVEEVRFKWNTAEYFPDFDFTVWVPIAVWTALAATADNRNAIIQNVVDNICGKYYPIRNNILTY
jgi:hypothetical protein